MYIKRKIFSTYIDENGEEKLFSTTEIMSEESYLEKLYSENELEQKEFNSRAQKALRKTYDLAAGKKEISYPEFQSVIIGKGRKANRKLYKTRGGNTNDSINVKALNLGAWSSSSKLSEGITGGLTNKKSELYDHGITDIEDAKRLIKRTHKPKA